MKSLTFILILILVSGIVLSDEKDGMDLIGSEENNVMMMQDTMIPDSGSSMIGGKIDFTTLEHAMEIALSGPAVLFFYAGWCPACRTAIHDIDENIDQLANITVIIVNYDKEKALKKKYGVTYQHTYVRINSSGEKIAIWSGGGVEKILKKIVNTKEN